MQISLSLDGNGLLVAEATDLLTGNKRRCEVNYKDSAKMSPDDVKRRRAELEKQLEQALARAHNPLEMPDPAAGAVPSAAPTPAPMPMPSPAPAPMAAPADPTAVMNPILRQLYQKAMASFMSVPADKQGALITLVGEIDQAARANDQGRLNTYTAQLAQLLQGVA